MQTKDIPRVARPVVAIYGRQSEYEALAGELTLDGYDVRLVSDPLMLSGVDLVVFGRTSQRDASLRALKAMRRSALPGLGARLLWISASSHCVDALRAFDAGADDVIRAPFAYAELLARIRALLRRDALGPTVLVYGPLRIDMATRTAAFAQAPLELRRREYALLAHLAREPCRVFTRAELLREVWGHQMGATRTVDSHASRLRRVLAQAGAEGWVCCAWRGLQACSAAGSLRSFPRGELLSATLRISGAVCIVPLVGDLVDAWLQSLGMAGAVCECAQR